MARTRNKLTQAQLDRNKQRAKALSGLVSKAKSFIASIPAGGSRSEAMKNYSRARLESSRKAKQQISSAINDYKTKKAQQVNAFKYAAQREREGRPVYMGPKKNTGITRKEIFGPKKMNKKKKFESKAISEARSLYRGKYKR